MVCNQCEGYKKSCELLQKRLKQARKDKEYLEKVLAMSSKMFMKEKYAKDYLMELENN